MSKEKFTSAFKEGSSPSATDWAKIISEFAATAASADNALIPILEAYKNSPGAAFKSLFQAWATETSRASRNGEQKGLHKATGRERLSALLDSAYGQHGETPVSSLFAKLSGSMPITVKDAIRMLAVMMANWPGTDLKFPTTTAPEFRTIQKLAEDFTRDLLSSLSNGRSLEWDESEIETRVFKLVDEHRVGLKQFLEKAGQDEGALIVAGSRQILIGHSGEQIIRDFHQVTSQFIGKDSNKGLLIFVADAALLEAGQNRFGLLYNLGLLSSAVIGFALFEDEIPTDAIALQKIDWTRWRRMSARCCVVLRRPALVDPVSGKPLLQHQFDESIANWQQQDGFEKLPSLKGAVRFGAEHVLPKTFPREFKINEALTGGDLYWDVIVKPDENDKSRLTVQYFIPPPQVTADFNSPSNVKHEKKRASELSPRRGRPPNPTIGIEESSFYLIRCDSEDENLNDAQRVIYRAARARLKLDKGKIHRDNLNSAAALRSLGFEVVPISIALSLLARSLYFSSHQNQ